MQKLTASKFHFEPPFIHSNTSSARASSMGGTSRPTAFGGLEVDHQLELGPC